MTDREYDYSNINWQIIDTLVDTLRNDGIPITNSPHPAMFETLPLDRKLSGPVHLSISPWGAMLLVAERSIELTMESDVLIFKYGQIYTDEGYATLPGPYWARKIFGDYRIPPELTGFGSAGKYQAIDMLESFQRKHRVTSVYWTMTIESVSPFGEESPIEWDDLPVSYQQRYEDRLGLAHNKMFDLLQEEYPAALVTVWTGDTVSPRAESNDGWNDSYFFETANELEQKAIAHAMELHPDPDPDPDPFESGHNSGWYCLTVEDEGFMLYMDGNADARPSPSLKDAVSYQFPAHGYGGYPLEYIVNDCVVLCGDCMTDEFLVEIEDYLSGASKVWVEMVDGDNRYYGDITCENGHMIQPQLCPLCGDPVDEPRPGEKDGNYRVIASQTNGELRIHGDCLLDEENSANTEHHTQAQRHVSREGLVYSVQIWGDRKDFIVDQLVENTIDPIVNEEEVN